jgi:pyruvate/2-oxoglutarate dehydrogenase complex dihydrolipoamide acyltransferase (E2) component
MAVDVLIPDDFWDNDTEGAISSWLFTDDDHVEAGDLIAEVMYEKSTNELRAPASGQLKVIVAAEQPVKKGQLVAQIVQ